MLNTIIIGCNEAYKKYKNILLIIIITALFAISYYYNIHLIVSNDCCMQRFL